jgi:hypothetical protein
MGRLRLGRIVVPDAVDDPRGRPDWYELDESDEFDVDTAGWTFHASTTRDLRRALAWQHYFSAECPELSDPPRARAMALELSGRADEDARHKGAHSMRIGSAFPSKYLKAADLQGRRIAATIDRVQLEEVDDGERPVAYFRNKDRGLVLNRTNANAITEIAGTDETDEWSGVRLVLYSTRVDFQGRRVDAIRIDAPAVEAAEPAPRRATAAAIAASPGAFDDSEEIPF